MIERDESDLILLQEELVHALSSINSPDKIVQTLESNPKLNSFRSYISKFDVDIVQVANELVHKWGSRQ